MKTLINVQKNYFYLPSRGHSDTTTRRGKQIQVLLSDCTARGSRGRLRCFLQRSHSTAHQTDPQHGHSVVYLWAHSPSAGWFVQMRLRTSTQRHFDLDRDIALWRTFGYPKTLRSLFFYLSWMHMLSKMFCLFMCYVNGAYGIAFPGVCVYCIIVQKKVI